MPLALVQTPNKPLSKALQLFEVLSRAWAEEANRQVQEETGRPQPLKVETAPKRRSCPMFPRVMLHDPRTRIHLHRKKEEQNIVGQLLYFIHQKTDERRNPRARNQNLTGELDLLGMSSSKLVQTGIVTNIPK